MAISYKQRCMRCKKNMVMVTSRTFFPVCYDCEKNDLHGLVKNPKMKKLFNIPESFYVENTFLRSIKINYLKFGSLSEKQIASFKKTVEELKKKPVSLIPPRQG
ncbi:MAG: hypothetical protein V1837_04240 [Candidatus Woesearchaeota archaeon]